MFSLAGSNSIIYQVHERQPRSDPVASFHWFITTATSIDGEAVNPNVRRFRYARIGLERHKAFSRLIGSPFILKRFMVRVGEAPSVPRLCCPLVDSHSLWPYPFLIRVPLF
jgi:hypothetical protein